eukprot:1137762-Pelagomonas_calceolata.AAC.2
MSYGWGGNGIPSPSEFEQFLAQAWNTTTLAHTELRGLLCIAPWCLIRRRELCVCMSALNLNAPVQHYLRVP